MEENCELCKLVDKMVKFYEDAYDLDFNYTKHENLSSSELKKYFNFTDLTLEILSVIYIRDGVLKGVDNKILMRDYLMDYGFLD